MSRIVLALLLATAWLDAHAQSPLPPCPTDRTIDWPNCFGTYIYESGAKFVGEFLDNKSHGQGTYTWTNGDQYIGEFRLGSVHGQGTLTFANGDKYVGEWRNGERNGQGTITWGQGFFKGSKYLGEFRNGKRTGRGALTFANGNQYVGEFLDGKRSGQGAFTFVNGSKYVGEYKDDQRSGQGIEYYSDGSVRRSGLWANNNIVRSYVMDISRFPFNAEIALVALVESGKAERERLAAEVEKTRQERLALETQRDKAERDRLSAEIGVERLKKQNVETQLTKERERLAAANAANQLTAQVAPSLAPRRMALVIGNAAYKDQPLVNPVNDSLDIAVALRERGFKVMHITNAPVAEMRRAVREFSDGIVNSDVALVYYSGHGLEVEGRNYFVPIGADIQREYEVVDQAYDANQITDMMQHIPAAPGQRVNILIVDACRDNPLMRSWRSTGRGLAKMDAPRGTFIAFATAPGSVASDGDGKSRNSPFTKHLLAAIKEPNQPIELVFKSVRRAVVEETKGLQTPWENSSLIGDFYFTVTQ